MKHYLHKALNICGENVEFAIKKMSSYMSLKTEHLQFLDIRSYLAPNYSYDAFIKAYKCNLTKGFFPYEYLDTFEKLNDKQLPPHEAFYSSLKNSNITTEQYNMCIDAWNKNNMQTMKDFLEWYNNLDVIPFIEAVEKMKTFYKKFGVYYTESENYLPLHGNGWYYHNMMIYCLKEGIINQGNIEFKTKSSLTIKPNYFNKFIDYCYNNMRNYSKLMTNSSSMIGAFKPNNSKCENWRSL